MPPFATTDTAEALTTLLIDALGALGVAGQPEDANRLAGRAWGVLRHEHPGQAQRINAVMHKLARLQPTNRGAQMPATDPQLDVRTEPPARRHELIFDTYESLSPGGGFVLVNDHDPKPLYYQFEAEHTGQFDWQYLEQGPEVWRVRIGRVG